MKAIECVLNRDKVKVMAKKWGIHKTTAFYWKHKILSRIGELVNTQVLKGEVEIVETLVNVNFEDKKQRFL